MNPLILQASSSTPYIDFNPNENRLTISGYSRPENVRDFYIPILDWLENYRNELKDKKEKEEQIQPIEFDFKFVYFNSSSAKFLYDIIILLNQIQKDGIPLTINWYYDKDDSEFREAGEDLSELAQVTFNFVVYQ
ncbi:MAG TPA: hypothetical protein DDY04_01775 [Bacteroidales bacterium]|nr:hypothetical protein [Bacteroidales bacterium]